MKKLKKILFVNRPELEGKWWHRLAKVLIYGSSVCVLIIGLPIAFYTSQSSIREIPFSGAELQYIKLIPNSGTLPDNSFHFPDLQTTISLMEAHGESQSDIKSVTEWYNNNGNDYVNITDRKVLGRNMITLLLVTCFWFVLWESIIYRSVIYIILGKLGKMTKS